jgi:hypothetical protein
MTLKMRRQTANPAMRLLPSCLIVLALGIASPAAAAGRTYKPVVEDKTPQYELCRLRKREFTEGGTDCFYRRQTGGKDALIRVDDAKVRCQAEYHCKRLK